MNCHTQTNSSEEEEELLDFFPLPFGGRLFAAMEWSPVSSSSVESSWSSLLRFFDVFSLV